VPAELVPVPAGLVPVLAGLARLAPVGLVLVVAGLVPVVAGPIAAEAGAAALDRGGEGGAVEDAVAGRVTLSAGVVAGLNVATDSIAPATRQTARMLASTGMTLPGAPNGPVRRRSRFRRRFARSSRW
jgi:hypothetical protein